MGRSRLAYRSKHRGILSENSRKAIQEAHQKKRVSGESRSKSNDTEKGWVEKENEMQILSENSEESEDELSTIDIIDFLPIFVRDREILDFQQEIGLDGLDGRKQDLFFPNSTDVKECFQSVPLNLILDSIGCDENVQAAFDDIVKSDLQHSNQSVIPSSSKEVEKDLQSEKTVVLEELPSSQFEIKQTSIMDEIDALL